MTAQIGSRLRRSLRHRQPVVVDRAPAQTIRPGRTILSLPVNQADTPSTPQGILHGTNADLAGPGYVGMAELVDPAVNQLADVEQDSFLLLGDVAHEALLQEALPPEKRVIRAQ